MPPLDFVRPCKHLLRGNDQRPHQQAPNYAISFVQSVDVPMEKLVQRWGAEYVRKLSTWLRTHFLPSTTDAEPAWVSKTEIFFGFLLSTQYLPPVYEAKRKVWLRNPHLVAPTYRRVQWFIQNLGAVAQALGQQLRFVEKWPSSAALGGLHPCLAVVLPGQLRSSIDRYLAGHLAGLPGLPGQRWRHVPVPEACLR